MRDVVPGINLVQPEGRIGRGAGLRTDRTILRWLLQEPGGFGLLGRQRLAIDPGQTLPSTAQRGRNGSLVRAEECDEVAVTHDIDPMAPDPGKRLVRACQPRLAPGPMQHANMLHAGQNHVVQERRAEHLFGQIEPGLAAANDPVLGHALRRRGSSRLDAEIDGAGHRPVIQPGRFVCLQYPAPLYREPVGLDAEELGCP